MVARAIAENNYYAKLHFSRKKLNQTNFNRTVKKFIKIKYKPKINAQKNNCIES